VDGRDEPGHDEVNMEEWHRLLPENLKTSVYRAGLESAWSRTDALRVVEILAQNGYTILGVDIWLAETPGPKIPTPFVYDWDFERDAQSPVDFIRRFAWGRMDTSHEGREPYVNILAERGQS
jgi:hypothetical protein